MRLDSTIIGMFLQLLRITYRRAQAGSLISATKLDSEERRSHSQPSNLISAEHLQSESRQSSSGRSSQAIENLSKAL